MKSFGRASMLLFTGFVAAQIQSKPFKLSLQSDDGALNGKNLTSCHIGAAIESLCIYSDEGSDYLFNTTEGSESPIKGYDGPGTLIWNLPTDPIIPESMSFYTDPSTNVALPMFQPSYDVQSIAFNDKTGLASVFSYVDDTLNPPAAGEYKALSNWYVCQTYYSGYQYQNLAWVVGSKDQKPQNPTCVRVELQRKFV